MAIKNTDRIEKHVELNASPSRVWRALTDYQEFNTWFGVKLEQPFAVGKSTHGNVLYKGYEHIVMRVVVEKMEPERLFSFRWHPYPMDSNVDYSKEPMTLVEFKLEKVPGGTLLLITESGFDSIPAGRRDEAFRMNDRGWTGQIKNIESYVSQN